VILRPLNVGTAASTSAQPQSVWSAIEKTQTTSLKECWMIPQPAHAVLSGEIAARLSDQIFPGITDEVVRGIALHDAGWGPVDAVAIQESRSKLLSVPRSFIAVPVKTTVAAWTGSIDTAEKVGPLAGYLVSRHFFAIFEQYEDKIQPFSGKFRAQETARQERLAKKLGTDGAQAQRLLEALQFSDVLSLYICCGLAQSVEFSQRVSGKPIRLTPTGDASCRLEPSPFRNGESFSISAIRHPRLKANVGNSAMFALRIE
jgi:hypothetical protein